MKIEDGKYYRTRDGRKVGPMVEEYPRWSDWPFEVRNQDGDYPISVCLWKDDGACDEGSQYDLVAEWTDTQSTTSTPSTKKLWCHMTPEEKGALLLAHHEGKVIQALVGGAWMKVAKQPPWSTRCAYRVKPEPTVEMVTLDGADFGKGLSVKWSFRQGGHIGPDTHRITFNMIDGKPDCASIKMEEL